MASPQDELRFRSAIARIRAGIMAVVFGMLGGTSLFLATVWLLIQDGPDVGKHLSLLGNYFPGYRVTWWGAPLGFVYGALAGAIAGGALAFLYNRIADWRHASG